MQKQNFIVIMNELDRFYGETWDHMKALGLDVESNAFTVCVDNILESIDKEVDPKRLCKTDEYCYDTESYLFEWLFGKTEFSDKYPTASDLYNYIMDVYAKNNAQEYARRAMGENLKED